MEEAEVDNDKDVDDERRQSSSPSCSDDDDGGGGSIDPFFPFVLFDLSAFLVGPFDKFLQSEGGNRRQKELFLGGQQQQQQKKT